MKYKKILITGGAGFVGSNLAIKIKKAYPSIGIIAFDNLIRKGSELNVPRLKARGISFIKGDVRFKKDLSFSHSIDLIIDCAAEPSAMAGASGSPAYVIDANLFGTANCLELARKKRSDFIFLSTSRVYPSTLIEEINCRETKTRFKLKNNQKMPGVSLKGISENFPIGSAMDRSFYGATKLCSEYLIHEYAIHFGLRTIIDRCSVIAGPWQMGKVDQGVAVLWMARHFWKNKKLSYIGYQGKGKQVRDFLHIDDLFSAINTQMKNIKKFCGEIYNLGGGDKNSLSLFEMTALCQEITGNKITITKEINSRPNDIKLYITDYSKFNKLTGWKPERNVKEIFSDIYGWISDNESQLRNILQ